MLEEIRNCTTQIDDLDREAVVAFHHEAMDEIEARLLDTYDNLQDAQELELALTDLAELMFALEELAYAYACRYKEPISSEAIMPEHLRHDFRPPWASRPTDFVTQDQINREINTYLAAKHPSIFGQ